MTPQLWERLKPLFHAALDRNAEDRAAFLSVACREDTELRWHLEKLLEAEAQPTGSLDKPLAGLSNLFSADRTRFHNGETVLGRFRILQFIGRGGMGEVYKAEDLELGVIALKTIRSEIASSPAAFDLFRQEVVLARQISGPQICRIHELFLLPASDGHEATVFLTMEYLEGVTLSSRVAEDGPLPCKEALGVALDLCEGLRLIHAAGIIHRDLKSGNIMLCRQGASTRTVLMDFGLAQHFDAGPRQPASREIGSSAIVGTPEYMAPEQFEGKPVTPATDIYALGIVLYELVTGIHPYAGPTPIAAAIRRARHPASPSVVKRTISRQWDRVIEHCLEYEPAHRFQSAPEVARALRPGPANLRYLSKDHPWIFRGVCALVFAALTLGIVHWWHTRQYYRPRAEALHWYDSGVSALREGNYVKATRSLQEATAQDNKFVMAHARLAEAWANLDFDGNAQRELLIAAPSERLLKPLDRLYLDAIHATVMKDHTAEVAIYRQILIRLPPDQKASGYVDLGMAYERAGDPPHALENYTQAVTIDNDKPAPFMHIAVLQSRLHHVHEADQAFQRARTLLSMEMNQEGLAELDFAEGYAANTNSNSTRAVELLQRSLDEANKIPSVQLQIRALTQLSSAVTRSNPPLAVSYAEQSIHLARENQLNAWAADGFVRLADAEVHAGKLQQAEGSLQDGLKLARQTEQPRVEALANLMLASLMNQKHLPDQAIGPAQSALDYYNKNGYFTQARNATLLLIRAERDKGQYQQALHSADAFMEQAIKSDNAELKRQAEEVTGTVLIEMENYPEALVHLENARSLADTASTKEHGHMNCAEALWRLGRYAESDDMLRIEPVNDLFSISAAHIRAESLLSQTRYREALSYVRQKISILNNKLTPADAQEFALEMAVAESHLGMKQQAMHDRGVLEDRTAANESYQSATEKLTFAEIDLGVGLAQQAHDRAVDAAAHFESTGQLDSYLKSAALAAAASKALGNSAEYKKYSAKTIDIISQIKQNWSPRASQTYLSRPDIRILLRKVPVSTGSNRR